MRKKSEPKPKAPAKPAIGWAALNIALNQLVKGKIIVSYKADTGAGGPELLVEVTIDRGADSAEVVSRVREALPPEFSAAQIRTRTA